MTTTSLRVWRLHLKPNVDIKGTKCTDEDYTKLFNECLETKSIGVGWPIDEPEWGKAHKHLHATLDFYHQLNETYGCEGLKEFILDMQLDDLVWVADVNNTNVYICKITSKWFYDYINKPHLLVNLRKCAWSKPIPKNDLKTYCSTTHSQVFLQTDFVQPTCRKITNKGILEKTQELWDKYKL